MSWKRAQLHAESMLENLGLTLRGKGRKDLRGRKLILVDDGSNAYRAMCFTIAAKLVKKRGGDVETREPKAGEAPHAKIEQIATQPPSRRSR